MLNLDNHIELTEDLIKEANLCEHFTRADLNKIGAFVNASYERDVESRKPWVARTEAAMDLAMQIQEAKTWPWAGCANIKFPLVTIAALQFHARAYPTIINGRSVVQCRVVGDDPQGISRNRAKLIGEHMSWQLLEQDEVWEEEQDRALLNVPIVGTAFKKTFYDASKGHNVSQLVLAKDLVLDYWARSVESCPVKTHIIPLFRNEIHERVRRGQYVDCLNEPWYTGTAQVSSSEQTNSADNRAGLTRPDSDYNTPFDCLEQHCWLDLDNDGYAEPYIVTFEKSSTQVLRIVPRFERWEDIEFNSDGEIIRIAATEYFTKIPFIPSPDGGIMDIGFGVLLGPLNESVNSAINQLFDAGTVSNTAGGFLGRGAKIRGGTYEFKPFGWHRVDASGDDLRKSVFPLPVREPSAVMFNLLSLIIDYTGRISGATDMMVGENPGQNTPAETSRTMMEQGEKIYSAIFKRVWRSMKQEFKKLFVLNSLWLPAETTFGDAQKIRREDYSGGAASVIPVADPYISSEGAKFAKATMLKEAAAASGGYDADEVERRYLQALGVDQIDQVYPGLANQPPPPPDVKIQLQEMKNQLAFAQLENKQREFVATLMLTQRLNEAKITEMMASVEKIRAETADVGSDNRINAFRAGIEAIREQNNQLNTQIDTMLQEIKNGQSTESGNERGGVPLLEVASDNEATSGVGQVPTGIPQGGLG